MELAPSRELVHRVISAVQVYTIARLRILEQIPGNPIGVAVRATDNVVALMARHLPWPAFNSVVGLRHGQADRVQLLVDWYRQHGVAPRFEIAAGDDDPALHRELMRLGFFPSRCHAALIGAPDPGVAVPDDNTVALVTTAEDMEDFLAAYVLGWGFPESFHEGFKRNARAWCGQPGWSLYVARVEGRPAAAAKLCVHDGVGYLADAATVPAFRNRGLHAALLHRRWRDAGAARVAFICSGADFLSTSHRNMERAGMRLLFLRSIWAPID